MAKINIFRKSFFNKNFLLVSGSIIVLFFITISISAPFLTKYDPLTINMSSIFLEPSGEHLFGTDELGRDVFARVLYGGRVSLFVGIVAVGISVFIGTILGLISGYYGKWVDSLIMRFTDVMLSFPAFFLILAVIAFLSPSIINVMVVIGLTGWMGVARLVRAETMSVTSREYIIAAELSGLSKMKILFKHILPNVITPVFVTAALGISGAILLESSLSFLGLGVQPPTPSWGNILTSGKDNIMFAWWLSLFPGVAILLTSLGYNMLGEGLRDYLDPKQNK